MSPALHTIRYPSGETEYRMSDNAPKVGEILRRNGHKWLVQEVVEAVGGTTIVTLRPQPFIEPDTDDG